VQSGNYQQSGASRGKRTAETVGGGAAVGALLGAIAGKGKGAAIGAGVGAAAGAGYQVLTKGSTVKVPSETKIDFTLAAPLNVAVSG
jgi:YMGG-like Gly-zipper